MARFPLADFVQGGPNAGRIMIKGLGREKGIQTAIAAVILMVNSLIVFQAISQLGEKDADGRFRFTAEVIPADYYLLLALSLGFGSGSMWLIRYEETQSRWGARLMAGMLMPLFLLLYTLNLKIFSWDHLQKLLVSQL